MATKVWKGSLQLGLLNIPVFMNVAARDKRISMSNYHVECNSAIKMPKYCPQCKKQLEPDELYRGYNTGSDKAPRIVKITDEELENITPETGSTMEIASCVRWEDVDPSFLAESFYLLPEDAGKKGYSLLNQVLAASNRVAIAQITKSQREHVVLIRPKGTGLMCHFLWFADEIAQVPEFNTIQPVKLAASEIKLGTQLVESLTSDFTPEEFEDGYRQRLTTLIASKMDDTIAAPVPVKVAAAAPAQDLMAALSASLANPPKNRRAIKLEEPAPKPKGKKTKAA